MVTAYQGIVQNGQIHFEDDPQLPEGSQVIVVVMGEQQEIPAKKVMTGADILESGLIGIWADREDITDSAEFVEALRRKAERRE